MTVDPRSPGTGHVNAVVRGDVRLQVLFIKQKSVCENKHFVRGNVGVTATSKEIRRSYQAKATGTCRRSKYISTTPRTKHTE